MLTGRDGVDLLAKSSLIRSMINSFMFYSEKPKIEEAKFLIYLLEGFLNILMYDNGIEFFTNCGIIQRLNQILLEDLYDRQWSLRINYLYFFFFTSSGVSIVCPK